MSAVLSGRGEEGIGQLGGSHDADRRALLQRRAAEVVPAPGEPASAYAARLSARLGSGASPDFAARLLARAAAAAAAGHGLRMLSLGTGNGVAEITLLRACETPVDLVLTGDDEEALSAVVAAFDPRHRVSYRVVDLEAGLARWRERFDIVFSHATLCRIVRLEPLLQDIVRLLTPEGELWVSREQAGQGARHGGRMLHWLHGRFVPLDERGVTAIPPLALTVEFDLASAVDMASLRAAAVEDALRAEAGRPAEFLDGIYAIPSAH